MSKSTALVNYVNNDKPMYDQIVSLTRSLRLLVGRAAAKVAKANADWHDDPEADDHAAYHASADVQFPRAARNQAIRCLVAYYLNELE